MTLRAQYTALCPEFDDFLFATVGEERDGMPLSVISALTELGLDPWAEATRLSSLETGEAVEQLVPMIARLPGERWASSEIRKIALGLIELLPATSVPLAVTGIARQARAKIAPSKMFWLVCLLVALGALASMVANGDLPFARHGQSVPIAQTAIPGRSD